MGVKYFDGNLAGASDGRRRPPGWPASISVCSVDELPG